ncbi:MAG: hypothetical protein ABEJ61_08660 [Haloferacaceae archaeon]
MSLSIGDALRDGADRFLSRTGAILVAAYAAGMVVYLASFNGLFAALLARYLSAQQATAATGVTYPAPVPVYAVVTLGVLVGLSALTVVAVRTFVAGATDHVPREFYTRRLAWTTPNTIACGVAFGLLVLVGTALLVVPGVVAYVGFVFATLFVAVEDENFVAALADSWRLVRPNFLATFGLLLVLVVGVGVVAGVASVVVSVALLVAGLDGWTGVVTSVLTAPLSILVLAVLAAAFEQLRTDDPARGTTPTAGGDPPAG